MRIELRNLHGGSTLTEPDGTTRQYIKIHLGQGTSEGCFMIPDGKPKRNQVMGHICDMIGQDYSAGSGEDVWINVAPFSKRG